ncbi:protein kinase [Nocardia sp. NPDC051832]|uniref:serine/threonine-protein kinase n=1 Tax=Nocardia sp. NPDC051832 TaxID=3155673 RepID=UPI00341C5283
MLAAGTTFAGYVIERQLGRGGMGSVYLARDARSKRRAALKLLNQELFSDHRIRARFEREADLVSRLAHPNIVAAYDSGLEGEQLWLAMQYIDGADAGTLDPQTLPPQKSLWIVRETAAALDFAHEQGVLHRDVKPANILLTRATAGPEQVFLTDFGIAKLRDDAGHLTQTGAFTATLSFASPEQLMGAPLDPTSDQYSLACTLFWLLTGAAPFESKHAPVVVQGHLQKPPPAISEVRWGLPVQLDAVMQRALSKHPQERFRSCTEFAEAVRLAMSGISSAGTAPTRQAQESSPQPPQQRPVAGSGPQPTYQMPSDAGQSMPRQPVAGHPGFGQPLHAQSAPGQPIPQLGGQMPSEAGQSMPRQPVAGHSGFGQPSHAQSAPGQPIPQLGGQMPSEAGQSMPRQPIAAKNGYGQPYPAQQQPVSSRHGYSNRVASQPPAMSGAGKSADQTLRSKVVLIIGLCAVLLVLAAVVVMLTVL